ncbi:MAG: hypothetical protein KGS09_17680 [Nitrospirae bacterium]|nr:hypothetical protein [Nitrospirota bacterium]MBU6482359.1 hypothetical protein [Nitrospirota bacterium]MDE3218899.1 hypothetical protein [Nitrospirota bacterium]
MIIEKRIRVAAIVVTATLALAVAACSQFEPRDKRFYYRAFWNFALREDLAELDSEFNGVDFGHSNLYENLLLTGGTDVPAIEDRARKETLAFIASKPRLNPNEEAIAPTYMKLAWRAQNTFDEAHALHRATYDIVVSDEPDQDRAIRNVLAYYQESAYAITARRLDHHRLDAFPYSQSFRKRFPLFNATIWAYHYLQVAVYDPLRAARDLPAKTQAVRPILSTYHRYLEQPPVEWTFMPLTAELSPAFAARYPEIANIFDNLHMLHDNISDILASEQLPTWEAKRVEIYHLVNSYYLASADATNPMIVKTQQEREHHH